MGFRVMHHLVRVGGVIYHELPAGGLVDRGLVSYQPKILQHAGEAQRL
ncbi:MAG TPA: hypothetical protein VL976_16230 [Xanthobacteraceae bacterium]|nr:hypothetical protein [Xanthobacteraceae bacterium]